MLTFSLILHYLYKYICILNVLIYAYVQLSAIKDLLYTAAKLKSTQKSTNI